MSKKGWDALSHRTKQQYGYYGITQEIYENHKGPIQELIDNASGKTKRSVTNSYFAGIKSPQKKGGRPRSNDMTYDEWKAKQDKPKTPKLRSSIQGYGGRA